MLLWHRHGVRFWYDQDEHVINVQGMRDGIAAARRYVLYLSVGALARPFVIFELVIALQLGKPIVFVHRECGLGGFAEARSPEEQQRQQDLLQQRQQRQLQRRYSRPGKAEETAPLLGPVTVVVAGAAVAREAGAGAGAVEEVEVEVEMEAADDGDEFDVDTPRGICVLPRAELHALRKGRPEHATHPYPSPSPSPNSNPCPNSDSNSNPHQAGARSARQGDAAPSKCW